jgi:nucleoside 2-deoxyribosyltransferase
VTLYVAAPWIRRAEAREARDVLQQHGYNVVSGWLDSPEDVPLPLAAVMDLRDLGLADAVVLLQAATSEGKAFESGYAYARGLPLIVVGERSHVFHSLWDIEVVPDLTGALGVLAQLRAEM